MLPLNESDSAGTKWSSSCPMMHSLKPQVTVFVQNPITPCGWNMGYSEFYAIMTNIVM